MKKSAMLYLAWAILMFAYVIANNFIAVSIATPIKLLFILLFVLTLGGGFMAQKKEKEEEERRKYEEERQRRQHL